jgi:hypothetical protein
MAKRIQQALLLLLFTAAPLDALYAQELFIQEEPASTMPKGVTGIRAFAQAYREPGNQTRGLAGLRILYGLRPKLTLMVTGTASNHHSKQLPPDFPDHNTPQIGVHLPWRFNGVNVYAKYRFFSKDGAKTHFRAAAYASASWLDVAHDEAEPSLLDDTKGVGGGLIATWLKNQFAVSFTGGFILPASYHGDVPDPYPGLPAVPVKVRYGRAENYSLSFGYRLLPFKYKNFRQTNINLYAEFIGKSYTAGRVFLENPGAPGASYEITGTALSVFAPNTYIELHPGIQAIIRSNLRLDFSAGFPLLSRSYTRYYPVFTLGIQRYFFR